LGIKLFRCAMCIASCWSGYVSLCAYNQNIVIDKRDYEEILGGFEANNNPDIRIVNFCDIQDY